MFNKKGEISTLVILGVLSIIGVATLISSSTARTRTSVDTQAAECASPERSCPGVSGCYHRSVACPAPKATSTPGWGSIKNPPTLKPISNTPTPPRSTPKPTSTPYPCYPRENNNWCRGTPAPTNKPTVKPTVSSWGGGGDIIRPTYSGVSPSPTGSPVRISPTIASGTNDEGNIIDQPTQDSLPPIFTGSDGGSCSGEGEWQIKCENKRGPCNFDAGVGIPYQCRSGKWVNANPSGECNRMCDTDGSSQQEIAQQQEQQTQQEVQDIRNNQQQTTNNNNTNTNTTGGETYTSGITQTPIGGNSFTGGNGQSFNTTPRITQGPATGSFSGGGGTAFNTTPRVTRAPVTKTVSTDGTTARYEFPSNATGSKTTVIAKSGGEIKVKETNIVSGCDDRGGCFSPSVDEFIDTVSGANDPRYQDRANAYAQAAENNSQTINNFGSNIVNGITNSTVYKGVETIIQYPVESLQAAGEIGKAIVTDPVGSINKVLNGLFGN